MSIAHSNPSIAESCPGATRHRVLHGGQEAFAPHLSHMVVWQSTAVTEIRCVVLLSVKLRRSYIRGYTTQKGTPFVLDIRSQMTYPTSKTVSQGRKSSGQGCKTDPIMTKYSILASVKANYWDSCCRSTGDSAVSCHLLAMRGLPP